MAEKEFTAYLSVKIMSKDHLAIKEAETEENFKAYLSQLGLFVCISNA